MYRERDIPEGWRGNVKWWRQNFHAFFTFFHFFLFFFGMKDATTVNWRYEAHLVNLFPGGKAQRSSGNYTIGGVWDNQGKKVGKKEKKKETRYEDN